MWVTADSEAAISHPKKAPEFAKVKKQKKMGVGEPDLGSPQISASPAPLLVFPVSPLGGDFKGCCKTEENKREEENEKEQAQDSEYRGWSYGMGGRTPRCTVKETG